LVKQQLKRWTQDQKVVGSIPDRVAVKWLLRTRMAEVTVCGQILDHRGIKIKSAFHPACVAGVKTFTCVGLPLKPTDIF